MRTMLVLAGWPDHEPPAGGWRGADLTGRALLLAHLPRTADPSLPVGVNEDRSVRAVLAGRLYNRRELTVALGGRHVLGGRDDAEIVAHLYEERGLKSVKALRGAFALALWDARRGRLLLARDQLGVPPRRRRWCASRRERRSASGSPAWWRAFSSRVGSTRRRCWRSSRPTGAHPPAPTPRHSQERDARRPGWPRNSASSTFSSTASPNGRPCSSACSPRTAARVRASTTRSSRSLRRARPPTSAWPSPGWAVTRSSAGPRRRALQGVSATTRGCPLSRAR